MIYLCIDHFPNRNDTKGLTMSRSGKCMKCGNEGIVFIIKDKDPSDFPLPNE